MDKSEYKTIKDTYTKLVALIIFHSDSVILFDDVKSFPQNLIEQIPNLISIFEDKNLPPVISLNKVVEGKATVKDFELISNAKNIFMEKVMFTLNALLFNPKKE